MAKLDLNLPVVDEKGVVQKGNNVDTLGEILANQLMVSVSNEESDILKYFGWAQKLGCNDPVDLDEGDAKKLRDWISENKGLFVIVKAPILKEIDRLSFNGKKEK